MKSFYENTEKWVNANGGVNGHPVKIIQKDDGGNPATANKVVRELVEQDKVQAIVGDTSLNAGSWGGYLKQKGIPCVSCSYFTTEQWQNPMFFPVAYALPLQFYGAVAEAKKSGATSIAALYCAEAPDCAQVPQTMALMAGIIGGIKVEPQLKIAAATPSYAAPCQAAKKSGSGALYFGGPMPVLKRILQDCNKLGYKPKSLTSAGSVEFKDATLPALQGNLEILATDAYHGNSEFSKQWRATDPTGASNQSGPAFAGFRMLQVAGKLGDLQPRIQGSRPHRRPLQGQGRDARRRDRTGQLREG